MIILHSLVAFSAVDFWGNSRTQSEMTTASFASLWKEGSAVGHSNESLKMTSTHALRMINAFMIYQSCSKCGQQIITFMNMHKAKGSVLK